MSKSTWMQKMSSDASLEEQLSAAIVKGRSFGKSKRLTKRFGRWTSSASRKRTSKGSSTKYLKSTRTEY